MVQKVLDTIDDDHLAVFAVWVDVTRNDSYESTSDARQLIHDARARHYFDGEQVTAYAFAPVLGTQSDIAWDVYLIYDGDAEWGDTPSAPVAWLHQKLNENEDQFLYDTDLEELLREVLN